MDSTLILRPAELWESVKIGNCGSPIETEAGWLVITHGVGPMRKYCIGAVLLDLHDPSKVIGRLREPLLQPEGSGREGYVPNVVYSCGSLIHGRRPDPALCHERPGLDRRERAPGRTARRAPGLSVPNHPRRRGLMAPPPLLGKSILYGFREAVLAVIPAPETTSSTRRFSCRPAAVALSAIGFSLPNPLEEMELSETPWLTR